MEAINLKLKLNQQGVTMAKCTFPEEYPVKPYLGLNRNCTGVDLDENWIYFAASEDCSIPRDINQTQIGTILY